MFQISSQQQQFQPQMASLRVQQGGIEFQQMWQQARQGCEAILNWQESRHLRGNAMTKHIVEHYTIVYRLASNPGRNVPGLVKGGGSEVVAGKDEQSTQVLVLYYLLREMLKAHLETRVKPRFVDKSGMEVLKIYEEQWKKFAVGLDLLSFVFRYLHNHWNKQGLPSGHVTTSTKPLGLILWGEQIVATLRGPLESELLACIRADREGGIVDPQSTKFVRAVLATFVTLANNDSRRQQTLADVFDNPYNRDTEQYYQACAAHSLQHGTVASYVKDALRWTADEMKRVERYTSDRSTIPASIRKTLLLCLVEQKVEPLFGPVDGLLMLLTSEAPEQLGDLFQLIKPSDPSVIRLADRLRCRVLEDGLKTVAAIAPRDNQGTDFIQAVIDLYRRYKQLIEVRFERHPVLMQALRQGCEAFVNSNAHHKSDMCAEYLARHANAILRPSQTRDEDVEHSLTEIVDILDFFSDRDVFQSTYSALLCQRLIQGNMREEWEDRSIGYFRLKCGRDFTYKWERMLADATTNRRELKEKYHHYMANASARQTAEDEEAIKTELHPMILTSAWWPLKAESSPFVSQSCIGSLHRQFEAFYKSAMGGRSLKWLLQFSNGVVEARINPLAAAPISFTVSALQWELLNLFNVPNRTSVSFQDVKAATQSTDIAAMQRAAFAFLKQKVLTLVDPAERDVEKQCYHLNTGFTSSQRRINFLLLAQGTAADPALRLATSEDGSPPAAAPLHMVQTERRFAVQAAIVRVMKSRRTATYSELLAEVEAMLRKNTFVVSPQDVKANLELLIEKEFVERSPNDPNTFVYLT